jgi:glycosyltransferase involved in cell wall biosynthesis
MKPIRVLHLITETGSGGAQIMLRNVTTRMNRARFENHVVSMMEAGSIAALLEADGIGVESLEMRRGTPDPRALLRLVRILRRVRPDIVQTWLYHADLLGTAAAWVTRVPALAWNIRNSTMDPKLFAAVTRMSLRLLAWLSPRPDAVVTNSRAAIRMHEELGYRPRLWKFLPNGFDIGRFQPDACARARIRSSLGIPDEAIVVGFFARFHPVKDHPMFFEAVRSAERPDVHYLVAGRDTEHVVDLALAIAPGVRVHALGERHNMPELTAALDIACSASASGEGFPNSIGEAMATAVPCVVTNRGDAAWLVGDAGLVVPAADAPAYAEALRTLIDATPDERHAIGARGRQRILRDFVIESIVRQYEEFYAELAAYVQGRH